MKYSKSIFIYSTYYLTFHLIFSVEIALFSEIPNNTNNYSYLAKY